jgi:hypothetical protein
MFIMAQFQRKSFLAANKNMAENEIASFEVFTATLMKMLCVSVVTMCYWVSSCRCFVGSRSL